MNMYARNFADKVSRFRILSIPLVFSMNANEFMNEEVRYNNLDLRHFDLMSHNEQVVNLSFPPNYRPLELPENIELKSRFGMYSLKFSSIPNGMKIERVQHFNQKIIQRKDYTEFKAFFNQMVEADDTKFIIQK